MDTPEGLKWYEAELPRRVFLVGYDYELIVVPHDHPALVYDEIDGDEEPVNGITHFKEGEIYLAQGQSLHRFVTTVWHEITHAINENNTIEDGDDEENVATRHGEAWPTFFQMNPKFMAWFNKTIAALNEERNAA